MTSLDEIQLVARIATQRMHARNQEVRTAIRWGTPTRPLPRYSYSGRPTVAQGVDPRHPNPPRIKLFGWTSRPRAVPSQAARYLELVAGQPTPYKIP